MSVSGKNNTTRCIAEALSKVVTFGTFVCFVWNAKFEMFELSLDSVGVMLVSFFFFCQVNFCVHVAFLDVCVYSVCFNWMVYLATNALVIGLECITISGHQCPLFCVYFVTAISASVDPYLPFVYILNLRMFTFCVLGHLYINTCSSNKQYDHNKFVWRTNPKMVYDIKHNEKLSNE